MADVKGVLTLVVPVELMAELDQEARAQLLTRSAYVRRIIATRARDDHFSRAMREVEQVNGETQRGHK
jgi:hypothetical protein